MFPVMKMWVGDWGGGDLHPVRFLTLTPSLHPYRHRLIGGLLTQQPAPLLLSLSHTQTAHGVIQYFINLTQDIQNAKRKWWWQGKSSTYIQSSLSKYIKTFFVFNQMDRHTVHFLKSSLDVVPAFCLCFKKKIQTTNPPKKPVQVMYIWNVYQHFPDLIYIKILILAQNYASLIANSTQPGQVASHSVWTASKSVENPLRSPLTRPCHLSQLPSSPLPLPLAPPPLPGIAQMTGCSLVWFLWCMLWWRISSSERANFFWQLDQRQLKGFSPDEKRVVRERSTGNRCFRAESPQGIKALLLLRFLNLQNRLINMNEWWGGRIIKVYALVLPVWIRVWVFRWSDRENFLWHVSHWKGFTPTQRHTHTQLYWWQRQMWVM